MQASSRLLKRLYLLSITILLERYADGGFHYFCMVTVLLVPYAMVIFRKFLPFGVKPRPNAQCPRCGSLERHRLLWLYLRDKTNLFADNLKLLDIAPMDCLQRKFRAMPNLDYISVDLESPMAMVKMDITDAISQ